MGWPHVSLWFNNHMIFLWFSPISFFWSISPLCTWHRSLFSGMLVEILDGHHIRFSMWPLHIHAASGNTPESQKGNILERWVKLITSALVRSPILTGGYWAGKKERKQAGSPWWRALLPTSTKSLTHLEPFRSLEYQILLGKGNTHYRGVFLVVMWGALEPSITTKNRLTLVAELSAFAIYNYVNNTLQNLPKSPAKFPSTQLRQPNKKFINTPLLLVDWRFSTNWSSD